ncbi:MAG: xanthine dehydrogenase FAD-binding subunit XdhB [Clostridiaceae bacterium]|jgi:xanthine dehydrogenase FAD-binding subunit|nr:xanthine dehydrogenase FAD-binding subunit XdhB [Clostridiaceae bacterium]
MYDIQHYYEAKSVEDAIRLRVEHPEAVIISGGSDILISIRSGDLAGCSLISIHGLDTLRGVSLDPDDTLRIGALTSFSHLMKDPLILEHIPVLAEAAGKVGGPQIRNIGTVGGNVCNGVTSADTASTLLAFDAEAELQGQKGKRRVPLTAFYKGPRRVDIEKDEIMTALLISSKAYKDYAGCYIKYAKRAAMDIATSGCSVNVKLTPGKDAIEYARVAFGVSGPVPIRISSAEEAVQGKPLTEETIELFAEHVRAGINPRTSWRASRDFRIQIQLEMARRCLRRSIERAGGEIVG